MRDLRTTRCRRSVSREWLGLTVVSQRIARFQNTPRRSVVTAAATAGKNGRVLSPTVRIMVHVNPCTMVRTKVVVVKVAMVVAAASVPAVST